MIDEEEPPVSVSVLLPKKQLAFALLVFERMLPSLITFSKSTGLDDSYCLQAREASWSVLQSEKQDALDASLVDTCLKGAPNTEDYSHELTSRRN
ncbi:MAG: hypothetical protein ABSE51_16970 [Terracidiphilus sp.]